MKPFFSGFSLIAVFILALGMSACSEKEGKPAPKPDSAIDYAEQEALGYISVLNERGAPLAGAKVLIGMDLDSPFSGNFLTTNSKGQVLAPEAWIESLPVTVHASGYTRITHYSRNPGGATFRLKPLLSVDQFQASGKATGFSLRDFDGQIDFSLVLSAFTRNDLLALDLTKIISPEMDSISVMGQRIDLPSNLSVPNQRENYILPIRIEKQAYRVGLNHPIKQRLFATHGRFPFKTVVDEIRRGTPFTDLINHFSILGGVVRDVSGAQNAILDLPINEVRFSGKLTFRTPPLSGNEVAISMAIAENDGWLLPTDIKRVVSNEVRTLSTIDQGTVSSVALLKNGSEFSGSTGLDRVSATITTPIKGSVSPEFLPLIADPDVLSIDQVRFSLPHRRPTSVMPLATVAILSEIRDIPTSSGKTIQALVRHWEVQSPSWVQGVSLPRWPGVSFPATKKKWEVAFIGGKNQQPVDLGSPLMNAATHVTHSSKDFQ